MSIGTISDVLTRIGTIEQQVQSLQSGTLLDSALGATGGSTNSASSAASPSDFASELAAAQDDGTTAGSTDAATASLGSLDGSDLGATGAGGPYSAGSTDASGPYPIGSTGVVASVSSASGQLTSSQQQFASTLSADTGLNPNVVSAWLLAEESGSAAQSRQAAGNNDWLNIGYTDSGTYGSGDSVWSDPTAAANATAAWLQGQDSIPGYGTASSGVQSILSSVGQTPEAQIQAIQSSGWSSGGYPSLDSLYEQITA